MKFEGFAYDVQARVRLTNDEVHALIKLSRYHHDIVCVAAGLRIGEQHPCVGAAYENGFLSILEMQIEDSADRVATVAVVWSFRTIGVVLKILEQRQPTDVPMKVKDRLSLDALTTQLNKVCAAVAAEHERLMAAQRAA